MLKRFHQMVLLPKFCTVYYFYYTFIRLCTSQRYVCKFEVIQFHFLRCYVMSFFIIIHLVCTFLQKSLVFHSIFCLLRFLFVATQHQVLLIFAWFVTFHRCFVSTPVHFNGSFSTISLIFVLLCTLLSASPTLYLFIRLGSDLHQ